MRALGILELTHGPVPSLLGVLAACYRAVECIVVSHAALRARSARVRTLRRT
jgi:hypothetical protein